MISVAVLRGGAAAGYYLDRQGCEHALVQDLPPGQNRPASTDPVGYYVNGRDVPGRWVGAGARALGLDGPLADGRVLAELLDGRHAGQVLVPPVWRRDDTGARVDVRRSGFDVTFSAPKSVSTLMALAEPKVAAELMGAHQQAVTEALGLLERLAARAARGHQGDGQRAPRIATSGMIAAEFTHTTSRALDPQLHTHVVIANLAQGSDGRWSALDSRTLHREATTASYLYQHVLRAELTQRLRVSWTEIDRGVAEVDGVPLTVRREFSTRRRQIEAALAERPQEATGLRGRARHLAAQAACLITRPLKRHVDAGGLKQQWADRAAQAGFSRQDVQALLDNPAAARRSVDLPQVARQALAADGVTREQSTFGQGALLRELISRLPAGAAVSTAQLLDTTAAAVRTEDVVPVLTADGRAYTTRDLLSSEAATLALATRTDQTLAAVDRAAAAATVARARGLRPEQQRVAFAILTSGLPVEVITGPAGCGKTAGLAAATDAWRRAGVAVAGTAVAALTAQGLQAASGAPSVSLARALSQPDRHLPAHGVLLVDEAGMVGTRQLHQLLTAAQQRDCKLVLVGDPDQLPELEAGGMFARLASAPAALQLHGHGRQRDEWEREALTAIRQGDVAAALNAYAAHGRLSTSGDREALQTSAVADYLAARAQQPDPWQVVLLASTRQQVRELNVEVRAKLLADGALSKHALTVDTDDDQISFRVGDQVLVTRNDHRRGLLNGTTATVTALDVNGLTLTERAGQSVTVGRSWIEAGHLEHGYAMTLHKAQGRTVHTALLVGDDGLSTQAAYVGMSRGTAANHLFIAQPDVEQLTQHCAGRLQFLRPARRRARAPLTRDARQALASDQLPRIADGRTR